MAFNIILDTLVGTVPMIGDLFDAGWKANTKNLTLLENHLNSYPKSKKANWCFLILLLGVLLLVVIATTAVSLFLIGMLLKLIK